MRDSNSTLARSKADSVSEKSARSKEVIIEAEVENQVPVDIPVNIPKSEILFLVDIFIFNERKFEIEKFDFGSKLGISDRKS